MKKLLPLLIIVLITCLTFFKIFTEGQFPYPGDLLVSFNYPWYSGGWDGYDSWTTHKEFIAMDAIRQHLPWHKLTFDNLKNFSLPLWNPYVFSGNPHVGNMQTFIFNPFNILFFILPIFEAWIILIILQIPLTIAFTYLFCRSLMLSKESSLFGGIAFAFSSYFINWVEIGIVGYSILWLPLILYSIQNLFELKQFKYLVLLILSSSSLIFAGHIQTAIFIFITAIAYALIKVTLNKGINQLIKYIPLFILWISLTALITAIQTIPALELYLMSPLIEPLSKQIFESNTVPLMNFIALLAPDFFGNPATYNFSSTLYGDGTPNIGTLPFLFAIFALIKAKRWEIWFFASLVAIFFLYVTRSPLFLLIQKLDIPLLTGTIAARSMFLFCFALAIISAFGLEEYLKKKNNKYFYPLIAIFITIYLLLFLFTYLSPFIEKNPEFTKNMSIAFRNLIIPFLTLISLPAAILVRELLKKFKVNLKMIPIFILFLATIISGIYQFNKQQPTAPKRFFYPEHQVISWLQDNAQMNRFHGENTSKIWNNIPSFFKIHSPEGYGVFRVKRYAELFASQESSKVPYIYERSTAEFSDVNSNNKKRLYNLTGVKYLLSKDDAGRDASVKDHSVLNDDAKLVWQRGKFKIYEREKAMPRFWLSNSYKVIADDESIIKTIYDNNFDLSTVIIEEEPSLPIESSPTTQEVKLKEYSPNKLLFSLDARSNTLFFISDTFYPGWNAYIDGKKTRILRADYTFRAVPIPSGSKELVMRFEPISFKIGCALSVIGLLGLLTLTVLTKKRKVF